MWECNYANEPADGKLIGLLLVKKMKWVLCTTFVGAILAFGTYFLIHEVFAPAPKYEVNGQIYVDYHVVEGYGISLNCYNAETWNTLIRSDELMDIINQSVNEAGLKTTDDLVKESISTALVSDSRMLLTKVVMEDEELAVAVSHGLLQAIYVFGSNRDGVKEICIMEDPNEATLQQRENRSISAIFTGAVLGLALSLLYFALKVTIDDSIYVPSSFQKRYQIPALGTMKSVGLAVDYAHLTHGCEKIAILAADDNIAVEEVTKTLQNLLQEKQVASKDLSSFIFSEDSFEQLEKLQKMDGVILVVKAASHNGRRIEKTIDCLHRRGILVIAGLLWDADEKLLAHYYK